MVWSEIRRIKTSVWAPGVFPIKANILLPLKITLYLADLSNSNVITVSMFKAIKKTPYMPSNVILYIGKLPLKKPPFYLKPASYPTNIEEIRYVLEKNSIWASSLATGSLTMQFASLKNYFVVSEAQGKSQYYTHVPIVIQNVMCI